MRTNQNTLPSSLCKEVRFTLPQSWQELSQEDLRYVLRLLWLYNTDPDWKARVRTAAFLHFAHVRVERETELGWLCRDDTGRSFILGKRMLPAVMAPLAWTQEPEKISVRLEQAGNYKAVDFALRELKFGDYLQVENFFQAFLQTSDENVLRNMARLLYQVPDKGGAEDLKEEILFGVFLWYNSAKQLLARTFSNFLKPANSEGSTVTAERLRESTLSQIRLLTKGDVTKQKYILEEIDTWTALAELDALAKEADEIQRKYKHGKK